MRSFSSRSRPRWARLLLAMAGGVVGCAAAEDVQVLQDGPKGAAGASGASSGAGGVGGGSSGGAGLGGGSAAGAAGSGGASGSAAGSGGAGGARDAGAGGARDAGAGGGSAGGSAGGGSAGGGSAGGGSAGGGGSGSFTPAADSGAPPGSLFFDSFEDGNFTAPSWIDPDVTLNGMWAVTSAPGNKVLAQSAVVSDWIMLVSGDYRWVDQVVEAKVRFTSAPGMAGVFARVLDDRNYYFLYLDATNIVLRKRVNGSSTTMVKVKLAAPIAVGAWHVLKLSVVGAGLTGYLDGTMLVPLTMSVGGGDGGTAADIRAGGIAVGSSDASAEFDDFTVTRP